MLIPEDCRPHRLDVFGMNSWTLVEPCCGSAALSLHCIGARRSLIPYQGSKWSLRKQLRELLPDGPPGSIALDDASWIWPITVEHAVSRTQWVLEQLEPLVEAGSKDPEAVFRRLSGGPVPHDLDRLAAHTLWLQRMSYRNKAIAVIDYKWVAHGMDTTAAYGRAATDKFGEVKPLGPALLKSVEGLQDLFFGRFTSINDVDPASSVVYIDPPYNGTTGYRAGGMSREDVIAMALDWHELGARVIISEAEPINITGWSHKMIRGASRSHGKQAFRRATRGEEWITFNHPS